MQEYNYTIIIPHKNIPELLLRCLDSIPQRDDIQVVIVDDDSDPRKVDFEHFPGLTRPSTEVYFDKTGKGAGRARNVGLEHAKGEWVLFADADDFFTYGIHEILNRYKDANSDVIYFESCSADCDTYHNMTRYAYTHEIIKKYHQDNERGEFLLRYSLGVPWSKIVRRSIIVNNNIKFDETPIHNDTTFQYLVGLYAKSISVCDIAGYCVTTRQGSISTTISDEKHLACIDVFSRKYKVLKDHGIELYEDFIPGRMQYLRNIGREDLYNKCIEIIERNGLKKDIIFKQPTHYSLFFYEDIEKYNDFLSSSFGHEMFKNYKDQKTRYKIVVFMTKLLDTFKSIKGKILH